MGNSLIDFKKAQKPINTLIKKISDGIGVLYEPTHIKRKARAEAEAKLIEVKTNIEINELQQRTVKRLLTEETKKQQNIENIIEKSLDNINENAKPEHIDDDWLSNFFDKCKNISNEEMQTYWSKLLSDEANNHCSISKKTIETFYLMDKKDAELFTKLLTYIWTVDNLSTVIIDDIKNEIYEKNGINFSTLNHLEDIGLIKFDEIGSNYIYTKLTKKIKISYYNNIIQLEFNKDKDNNFIIGCVLLTKVGKELSKIVSSKMDKEYFEYMKDKLSKQTNITLID